MSASMIGAVPGGAGWTLAGAWAHESDVGSVDFTGLGRYGELAVVGRGLTLSASGYRRYYVSSDGGGSWISGSGLYFYIDSNGAETDLTWGSPHFNAAGSGSFAFRIAPFGGAGGAKVVTGAVPGAIAVSAALDALRFDGIAADFSTPVTFTGGSIAVWGR